jgi:hypothetical protein
LRAKPLALLLDQLAVAVQDKELRMLDELRRRQDHLARIRQARKEMEAETAAAAARQRIEEAEDVTTKATAAQDTESPDAPICRATTASWLSTATTSCS